MRTFLPTVVCAATILAAGALQSSCGSGSPTEPVTDRGYVSLRVEYATTPAAARLSQIDDVSAYVYAEDSTLITSVSLDNTDGNAVGTLEVPVGNNRWLDLVASESSTVIWLGNAVDIDVAEAETTDVSVTMHVFAPVMRNIDNADGNGDYTVGWSAVALATGYTLSRSADQAFTASSDTAMGLDTTYSVTSQDIGEYWYRSRAISNYGNGAWSNARAATVTVGAVGHIEIDIPWPGSPTGYPEPIAHWSFDDPQHVGVDESGNGNNLTIPGTYTSVDHNGTGDAVQFDAHSSGGSGPYGPHVSTSGLTYPGADGFTVAMWVKVEDGVEAYGVQDYWGSDTPGESYFRLWTSGVTDQARFIVRSDNGNSEDPIVSASISSEIGNWVHIAGVYVASGTMVRLFVNGVRKGSGNTVGPMATNNPDYLYVSGSFDETFAQAVDDVMLWDRALTDEEVAAVAGM